MKQMKQSKTRKHPEICPRCGKKTAWNTDTCVLCAYPDVPLAPQSEEPEFMKFCERIMSKKEKKIYLIINTFGNSLEEVFKTKVSAIGWIARYKNNIPAEADPKYRDKYKIVSKIITL